MQCFKQITKYFLYTFYLTDYFIFLHLTYSSASGILWTYYIIFLLASWFSVLQTKSKHMNTVCIFYSICIVHFINIQIYLIYIVLHQFLIDILVFKVRQMFWESNMLPSIILELTVCKCISSPSFILHCLSPGKEPIHFILKVCM